MDLQNMFPVSQQVDVYVTHVHDDSGYFFVQINNEEAGKLDDLMEEIDQFIASGESQSLTVGDIDVGAVYLAQYSADAKWYRARVVAVKPSGICDVHFIDYGNTEQIPVKFVRQAQPPFLRLHPQAFKCELDGMSKFLGPSLKSAISTMSQLILEQELVGVTSAINENVLSLKLFTDASCNSSILDSLLSQVQRTPQPAPITANPAPSTNRKYTTLSLTNDAYMDFHVSHVQDPYNFSCQLLEEIPKILELLDELAEEYSEADVPLLSSTPGHPCCAKFYDDDCWYRAVITNSSAVASGSVDVKFVDYGNSQTTSLNDVKGLKEKYLDIPIQAIECSLQGLRPSGNSTEWSAQAKELFSKLTSDKHIIAHVCSRESSGKYQVQLIDMTGDMEMQLDQILIAAKYAEKVGNTLLSTSASKLSSTPVPTPSPSSLKVSFPFTREVITPGKEEKVLVSSVSTPSSFYCMLYRTSSKLEKLMTDIARHYSGLGRDDEWLSSPSVGDPCCAKFSEDSAWYRAIVKEVHSSGKVKVQFVDYGNYDTVIPKDVKRLAPQFSELPCQGIECSMHRICANSPDWKHADIKKFEDIALEFTGKLTVISENADGVKSVELLIMKGNEVNAAEAMLVSGNARLKEGACSQTENIASVSSKKFPKLNLPLGTYEDVFVTHVDDPANFWCQLVKHKDELDAVMNAVEEHCMSSSTPLRSPSLGLTCCAQFSDDAWYRASITGVMKNSQVEVHFVDYGNYDTVSLSKLRDVKQDFMKLPAQAFKCRLEQIDPKNTPSLASEVIEKFTDLTVDKELVGMIASYDESTQQYLISCTDTSDGNTLDIYEQIASLLPQSSIKECTVAKQDLKVGRREHICVTSVTGVSTFYCQPMRSANQLDSMMGSMDEHYKKLTTTQEEMIGLQPGDYCVANYTEDESWYRAKIVDVKSNSKITVHYIDFGNGEELTAKSIKRLAQSFAQLPEQVVRCSLAGDTTGLSDSQFVEVTLDKEFDMEIVSSDDKGIATVNLYTRDTKKPVIQLLTKEEPKATINIHQSSLSAGSTETVFVSFASDVSKFYIQTCKSADSLADLMDKIDEYYSSLSETQDTFDNPQIGMFCIANFSEDNGWYRAKVTVVHGNSVEVLYIDYGNSEVLPVTRTKTLKPDFASLASQAVQCELSGITSAGNEEISSKFVKLVEDPEVPFDLQVVAVQVGNVHEVTLINKETGVSVNEEFESKSVLTDQTKEAGPAKLSSIPLTTGETYNGQCGVATSPSQFWFSLNNHVDDLNNLLDSLAENYSSLGPSDLVLPSPSVGSYCCCQFSEDLGWYRAKIISISDGRAEVCFVDFGNSENVELNALKVLKEEYQSLPEQAIQCCLNKANTSNNNTWTEDAKTVFTDLVVEKDAAIKVIQKLPDNSYIVDLLDTDGKDLALGVLVSKGFVADSSQNASVQDFKPFAASFNNGDYIDVNPSYCKSPEDFFCQVLTENNIIEFNEMTNKLQEYCSSMGPSDSAVSAPLVDIPCCVLYSVNNTWNRGKITKVNNNSTVKVQFVDYGNEETVALSQVKELLSEFLVLPIQCMQCCLSSVKPSGGGGWCDGAVPRFLSLVDQKYLVAKVISKGDDKVTMELYDTKDDNVDVNIAQVLVNENHAVSASLLPQTTQPTAQQSQPTSQTSHPKLSKLSQLQPSSGDVVYITSVESPDSVYCQLSGTEERLENLMTNLKDFYESGQGLLVQSISPNDLCTALFSEDDTWYRATAEEVSPEEITVRFIDYGNTDTLSLDNIRVFDSQFLSEQVLAVECKLSGIKPTSDNGEWSAEAADFLSNAGGDDGFVLKVISSTNLLEVTLSDQNGDLSQRLINEGLAKSSQHEPAVVPVSAVFQPSGSVSYQPPVINVGTTVEVYITDVTSPGQFYCQLADYGDSLDEMMDAINEHYSNMDKSSRCVTSPKVGHACVTVFEEDNLWYRARIESISNNDVNVRFIDYGNTQQAKVSDLKEIEPQFLKLPVLAVECTLDDKKTTWTTEQTEKFKAVTGEEKMSAEVTGKENVKYVVRILQDGNCVSDSLLQTTAAQFHIPSQGLQTNQTESVYVVYAKSSSEICIQLSSYSDQLDQVMATIDHACQSNTNVLKADQATPGSACCAFFEDGWYRAVVMSVPNQEEVTVDYVDYGNTATLPLSELRAIPDSCIALPRQAIHCVLDGAGLEAVSKEMLENTLMDTPLSATFIKTDGSQWSVQLKQDNVDVTDVLLINTEVVIKDLSFVEAEVTADSTAQVYVSFTASPGEFYVQKSSSTDDLEMLDNKLNEVYGKPGSTTQLPKVNVGDICGALFSEDGRWYRAIITAIQDDSQVQVHFVDHGNTDVVQTANVVLLKEEFLDLPILSIKCSLDTPGTVWSDSDFNKFEALTIDQELTAEFTARQDDNWLVRLTCDGKSVLDLIRTVETEKIAEVQENLTINKTKEDNQEKFTISKKKITEGQAVDCVLSHAESTGLFYMQALGDPSLDKVTDLIAETYPSLGASDKCLQNCEVGSFCCVKFSEDDQWYRAEVTELHSDNEAKVLFVDYGNSETADISSFKQLFPELCEFPQCTIPCTLAGEKTEWSPAEVESLEAQMLDKTLAVTCMKSNENRWDVEIEVEGTSLTKLPDLTSDAQADSKSFTLATTEYKSDVKFLMAESENVIWLQPMITENELTSLMHSIAENQPSQPMPVSEITTGKPCLCKFTEDDEWYRAEIIEFKDGQVTVKYVDYGNTETVESSRVSPISDSYMILPAQAIMCTLNGVPTLTEDIINKLNDEYVEVQLQAEIVEKNDDVYSIKLFETDGKELITNLAGVTNGETSKEPLAVVEQKSLEDQEPIHETVADKEINEKEETPSSQEDAKETATASDAKESSSVSVEATTTDVSSENSGPSSAEPSERMQPFSQDKVESDRMNEIVAELTAEELAYYTEDPEVLNKSCSEEQNQALQNILSYPENDMKKQDSSVDDISMTTSQSQIDNSSCVPQSEVIASSAKTEILNLKSESKQNGNVSEMKETLADPVLKPTLQTDDMIDTTEDSAYNDISSEDKKGHNLDNGKMDLMECKLQNGDSEHRDLSQEAEKVDSTRYSFQNGISTDDKKDLLQEDDKVGKTERAPHDGVLSEQIQLPSDEVLTYSDKKVSDGHLSESTSVLAESNEGCKSIPTDSDAGSVSSECVETREDEPHKIKPKDVADEISQSIENHVLACGADVDEDVLAVSAVTKLPGECTETTEDEPHITQDDAVDISQSIDSCVLACADVDEDVLADSAVTKLPGECTETTEDEPLIPQDAAVDISQSIGSCVLACADVDEDVLAESDVTNLPGDCVKTSEDEPLIPQDAAVDISQSIDSCVMACADVNEDVLAESDVTNLPGDCVETSEDEPLIPQDAAVDISQSIDNRVLACADVNGDVLAESTVTSESEHNLPQDCLTEVLESVDIEFLQSDDVVTNLSNESAETREKQPEKPLDESTKGELKSVDSSSPAERLVAGNTSLQVGISESNEDIKKEVSISNLSHESAQPKENEHAIQHDEATDTPNSDDSSLPARDLEYYNGVQEEASVNTVVNECEGVKEEKSELHQQKTEYECEGVKEEKPGLYQQKTEYECEEVKEEKPELYQQKTEYECEGVKEEKPDLHQQKTEHECEGVKEEKPELHQQKTEYECEGVKEEKPELYQQKTEYECEEVKEGKPELYQQKTEYECEGVKEEKADLHQQKTESEGVKEEKADLHQQKTEYECEEVKEEKSDLHQQKTEYECEIVKEEKSDLQQKTESLDACSQVQKSNLEVGHVEDYVTSVSNESKEVKEDTYEVHLDNTEYVDTCSQDQDSISNEDTHTEDSVTSVPKKCEAYTVDRLEMVLEGNMDGAMDVEKECSKESNMLNEDDKLPLTTDDKAHLPDAFTAVSNNGNAPVEAMSEIKPEIPVEAVDQSVQNVQEQKETADDEENALPNQLQDNVITSLPKESQHEKELSKDAGVLYEGLAKNEESILQQDKSDTVGEEEKNDINGNANLKKTTSCSIDTTVANSCPAEGPLKKAKDLKKGDEALEKESSEASKKSCAPM